MAGAPQQKEPRTTRKTRTRKTAPESLPFVFFVFFVVRGGRPPAACATRQIPDRSATPHPTGHSPGHLLSQVGEGTLFERSCAVPLAPDAANFWLRARWRSLRAMTAP